MNTRLTDTEKELIEALFIKEGTFASIARYIKRDERTIKNFLNKKGYKAKSQSELQRKYPLAEDFFDKIDTEEKAYILGLLYADGYNNINKNEVSITLKEDDKEILDKITNIIQPTKPIFFLDMSADNRGFPNSKNQYRLSINNKHISKRLNDLGCGALKTNTLTFPTDSQVPSHVIRHFIRGYFDGDGSISNGKNIVIDLLSTYEFLESLQDLLFNLFNIKKTVKSKRHKDRDGNVFRIQISSKEGIKKFCDWIYKDSTIHLERKYKVYEERIKNKRT